MKKNFYEKNQYAIALAVVVITAMMLRFYPAMQSTHYMKFDSYYHYSIAKLMQEKGIITWEPFPQDGRPHLYPPGYHLLLIFISMLGVPLAAAVKYALPAVFSLSLFLVYWFVKKNYSRQQALITSFLMAVNPVLITESFGSPQSIAFPFFILSLHFLLKKQKLKAGLTMGLSSLFTPMGFVYFSIPLITYELYASRKKAFKFLVSILTIPLAWLALISNMLYSYSSTAFEYLARGVKFMQFINPWYLALSAIPLSLVGKPRKEASKVFLIFTATSIFFYFSFYFTKIFHSWRQPFFLMIAISFIAGEVFVKNKKAFVVFTAILLLMLSSLSFPGLSQSDYLAVNQLKQGDLVLAGHDTSAVILAETKANTMLDISFENIENKTSFRELEDFFWKSTPSPLQPVIDKYKFNKVLINSNAWSDKLLDELNISKVYVSTQCWGTYCLKPASIYEIQRK